MRNEFFLQFEVLDEQLDYANNLVEYSILHHPVSDIFKDDPRGSERQREFRLTGTLGEVVFADAYNLIRPARSFGAIDGQDFGQDFILEIDGQKYSFDVKTMSRRNNKFRTNYVLNLPHYQMVKEKTITEFYYCVNLHKNFQNHFIVSLVGYVSKKEILNGVIGILYKAGTKRIKDDGSSFVFQRDTYEVDFKDITTPILSDRIKAFSGFQIKRLLND